MRGVETNESNFLPPDVAFRVSSSIEGDQVRVRWVIADGYYLYRQRMAIRGESPDLVLEPASFPAGTIKVDPYLGTQAIFTQQVEGAATFRRIDGGAHPIQIKVSYQGCAEAGLCYPPLSKVLFPRVASGNTVEIRPVWERYAILGGGLAFLASGLLLRKDRRLDTPA